MDKNVKKMQGSREPSDISIETHSYPGDTFQPVLPYHTDQQGSSKQQLSSRGNSEEKSVSPCPTQAKESNDMAINEINFMSGNPFVEVTKGILHLFKEK